MVFRRREARCCVLVLFVLVVIISSLMLSSEYLQPHLVDLSLPKIEVPGWLRPQQTATVSYEDPPEDEIQESSTKTVSAPETSTTAVDTRPEAPLGPHDVGIETILAHSVHVPGFTVMDNLYLRNGTFFVLTSDASQFPLKAEIISGPARGSAHADLDYEERDASARSVIDQDLRFLEPSTGLLGRRAVRIYGLSVIVCDPPSTMDTFYSWWAEIVLGSWRVYSSAMQDLQDTKEGSLSIPSRFILPTATENDWQDASDLNGPLMRIGLPSASLEKSDYWKDLERLDTTIIFDRVVLVSREAASSHPYATEWLKMLSGAMQLTVSADFWAPIRTRVVRNILGYLPILDDAGAVISPAEGGTTTKPVIAYFSRQQSSRDERKSPASVPSSESRKLAAEDHQGLVDALRALEEEGVCEMYVLEMERAGVTAQIELAARSTIILGVHGNALTNQLWMQPSPRSSVVEIMWPQAYAFDYEIVARNMGHKHFAVWNDTLVTYPEGTYHKGTNRPAEFDSDAIPVNGPAIARFLRDRLALADDVES